MSTRDVIPPTIFMSDPIYRRTPDGDIEAWGFVVDRAKHQWCVMTGSRDRGVDSTTQGDWIQAASEEEAMLAANGMRIYQLRHGYKANAEELPVP